MCEIVYEFESKTLWACSNGTTPVSSSAPSPVSSPSSSPVSSSSSSPEKTPTPSPEKTPAPSPEKTPAPSLGPSPLAAIGVRGPSPVSSPTTLCPECPKCQIPECPQCLTLSRHDNNSAYNITTNNTTSNNAAALTPLLHILWVIPLIIVVGLAILCRRKRWYSKMRVGIARRYEMRSRSWPNHEQPTPPSLSTKRSKSFNGFESIVI